MNQCIFLRRVFIAILGVVALTTSTCWADTAKPNSPETRQDLLRLHNKERLENQRRALKLNPKLTAAAQAYAEYLAKSGKFSHTAKGTVSSRVKRAGYDPKAVGENIAVGQKAASTVVSSWMQSKGHKKNLMNQRFSEVGFGIARDKDGRLVWVTDFGDR